MKMSELKRNLYRYKDLKSEYQQIAAIVDRLKNEVTGDSPTQPAVGFRANTLISNYSRKREKLLDAMIDVERLIEQLDDPKARELMRCRYIDGMDWGVFVWLSIIVGRRHTVYTERLWWIY